MSRIYHVTVEGIRLIEKIFMFIALGMLLGMMFLGTGDILGRYLFNHPIKGAMEGSQLLMAGVALLCWGYTQASKSHIRIDILIRRYPEGVQKVMDLVGLTLTIIIFGLITWQSAIIAIETLRQHRMLDNINLSLFPFKLMVPMGAIVLCLESVIQFIQVLGNRKNKNTAGTNRK